MEKPIDNALQEETWRAKAKMAEARRRVPNSLTEDLIYSDSPPGSLGDDDSNLSPSYEHVRSRMLAFKELPEDYRKKVWSWVSERKRIIEIKTGRSLPAPWVFVNEFDAFELEWEFEGRFLMLRLHPDAPFEYHKSDENDEDETGSADAYESSALLEWLLVK